MAKRTKPPKAPSAAEADQEAMNVQDAASALTLYGNDPRSLVIPDNMPEADYLAFGSRIGHAMEFASWRIGDYVNYGVKQYGYKDYEKIATVTGLAEVYLRTCASVASRVPVEMRGQHSLEKFRLMLQRRNEAEPIEKLVKRLGGKTTAALRDMGKSGSAGSSGSSSSGPRSFTASELHQTLLQICNDVSTWEKSKIALLATYDEKNPILDKVRDLLNQLADQCEEQRATADAQRDAASSN